MRRKKPVKTPKSDNLRDSLVDFVRCITDTGGVKEDKLGMKHPVADPTWTDLGDAYVKACGALGMKPLVVGRHFDE